AYDRKRKERACGRQNVDQSSEHVLIKMEKEVKFLLSRKRAGTSVDSDSDTMEDDERRPPAARMGRRFTLNPLIFAKEEQEARRQSLAQLKLSYYPRNAHPSDALKSMGVIAY
uniref:Prohibitin n=1 Tax=Parascaris univalens TaxID=6257 RepID=A0A915AID6_PARUN